MVKGCGNHGCHVQKPKGLGTNGICTCMNWRGQRCVQELRQHIAELERALSEAHDYMQGLRAEERERCAQVDTGPIEVPPHIDEQHNNAWWDGFYRGVSAITDAIRALGEQ